MKKFFAIKEENEFIFEGDELAHFNVLRCGLGEKVLCYGNDGLDYLCEVVSISKKRAVARIISFSQNVKNPKKNITLFQGLVKGEKLDLIVQKLTELGASELVTFESEFAVAKANNNKIERLNKVSREACKQCGRSLPLKIKESVKFKQMLEMLKEFEVVLFANETNTKRNFEDFKNYNNIAIIIGSEGGFSENEINALNAVGAVNFGLGERILRAETAAIALCAIIGYFVEV